MRYTTDKVAAAYSMAFDLMEKDAFNEPRMGKERATQLAKSFKTRAQQGRQILKNWSAREGLPIERGTSPLKLKR